MIRFFQNYGLFLLVIALIYASPVLGDAIYGSPERPGTSTSDPIQAPRDLSGKSIKCSRLRVVHSENPDDKGASAYLIKVDPWLGYQRGRELFLRDYSSSDGVFGESGKLAGASLDDYTTKITNRDNVASCMLCHNVPFRHGGAGATIFKNGGMGRNTPHLFGAGLIEMLGWQTRLKLLHLGDINRNGFIDKGEAENVRAIVVADSSREKRSEIDFGCFGDQDNDGKPDLNSVCFVWYVDKDGKRISWARSLSDEDVAGYNFEIQVFGWGHGRASLSSRIPITSTIRAFTAQAFDNHAGMQACDPTLNEEPNKDGLALISLNGSQQFYTGRTRDRGQVKDKFGISQDDPDRDGVVEELSEGDMDLIEFYQLNHPSPVEVAHSKSRIHGKKLMNTIGCTSCHTSNWKIEADNRNDSDYTMRYPGDRRSFNLEVVYNSRKKRLEGKLHNLIKIERDNFSLARDTFVVESLYSDFLHHDLGPNFHQIQFDGSVIKKFRTAPLWGVGSSAPYGHDGASLTLDSVIRRHGGEAKKVIKAYEKLKNKERLAILDYLSGLTLYSVDDLPCDINGDGKIDTAFMVAGKNTGVEKLNPEWLFLTPGKIEGEITNPNGIKVKSFALTNFHKAYGLKLKFLKDTSKNGFPDILFQSRK